MAQGGKKLGQQMKAKAAPRRGPLKIRKGARDIMPKNKVVIAQQSVTRTLEKAIKSHIETQIKEKSGIKQFHVLASVGKNTDGKKGLAKKKKSAGKVVGTGRIIREQTKALEKAGTGLGKHNTAKLAAAAELSTAIDNVVDENANDDDDDEDDDDEDDDDVESGEDMEADA